MRVLCRALQVTRSAYYAWCGRPPAARVQRDQQLQTLLRIAHAESRRTYGRPRLRQALRARGVRGGDKRVARLMRAAHLVAPGRAALSRDD